MPDSTGNIIFDCTGLLWQQMIQILAVYVSFSVNVSAAFVQHGNDKKEPTNPQNHFEGNRIWKN